MSEKTKSPFHLAPIKKGVYGKLSKVQEELDEALDAEKQGDKLLLLIELSDLLGAVEGVAETHGFTLEDLKKFSDKVKVAKRMELSRNVVKKPEQS